MESTTLENKEIAKMNFKPAGKTKFFSGASKYVEISFEKIYNEDRIVEFLDHFINDVNEQFEGIICVQSKNPRKNKIDTNRLYQYGFKFSDDDKHFEMLVYHFNKEELPPKFEE